MVADADVSSRRKIAHLSTRHALCVLCQATHYAFTDSRAPQPDLPAGLRSRSWGSSEVLSLICRACTSRPLQLPSSPSRCEPTLERSLCWHWDP